MLKGSNEKDTIFFKADSIIDSIAVAESRMQRDLLRVRTGLLRNYDPLDDAIRSQHRAVAELEDLMPGNRDIALIANAVDRQSSILENFKSDNALLQNSISYFDALSNQLSDSTMETSLLQTIAVLEIKVSELTHGTAGMSEDLRSRIARLSTLIPRAEDAGDVTSIIAHGNILVDLIPKVREFASAIAAASSEPARRTFAEMERHRRLRRAAEAERYRIALYIITLGLLALLVRVFLMMQNSIDDLRKTSKYQYVMATASSRFLTSHSDDMQTRVMEVLTLISEELDIDRSCLLRLDDPEASVQWVRQGTMPPEDWPGSIEELVPLIAKAPSDIMFLHKKEAGQEELHERLIARGLKGWSCARLHRGDTLVGILCLERSVGIPRWSWRARSLLSVLRDMFSAAIERQRIWQEQRDIELALRRAQRLEAIGTFTSGVAHNINNVLNVLLGHAEIAAGSLQEGTRAAHQIELMMQAGGHAKEIVSQILDFGRRGRSTQHTTSIDAVFAETKSQLSDVTGTLSTIHFDGEAAGALVCGEPSQLQQLLINLISNASQASLPGASVEVSLTKTHVVCHHSLSNGRLEPGDYACIKVSDTGRGMDEAVKARIFEPFFTTRPAGTGLGLATAYEFVQECGGAFDVRSAISRGSTFAAWLPVVSRSNGQKTQTTSRATLMVVSQTSSAALEDEEMLAALGFEPVGFADPIAALDALRDAPTRFDLVIVDDRLSDMSGVAFADHVRKISTAPILLSLATDAVGEPTPLVAASITDVVRRPWLLQSLHSILTHYTKPEAHGPASIHL